MEETALLEVEGGSGGRGGGGGGRGGEGRGGGEGGMIEVHAHVLWVTLPTLKH